MPIYEYLCGECGHQLEVIQKLSDAPLTLCPHCKKEALRKQVSAPAFRLSGTGWYETDFKSDKEKRRNLAGAEGGGDKESSGDRDKSAATTTDKKVEKPAAKADSPKTEKAAAPTKAAS